MNQIQVGQKSYQMPPLDGLSVAHFLTVSDIERSARYYEKVFGASILSLGDGNAPGYLQLANIWMILNVGGGPTPDKPTVTLSVPDPNRINSFMNFRVADIQACYELWKSRGAEFITKPIPKYGETRCYIRDPDGYLSSTVPDKGMRGILRIDIPADHFAIRIIGRYACALECHLAGVRGIESCHFAVGTGEPMHGAIHI
jgi:predicted enzyme related to lactoylglutathione lyase